MSIIKATRCLTPLCLAFLLVSCGGDETTESDGQEYEWPDVQEDAWRCIQEDDMKCRGGVLHYCAREGEFLVQKERDCIEEGMSCIDDPPLGCVLCRPGQRRCGEEDEGENGQDKYECDEEGQGWAYVGTCNPGKGEICVNGYCVSGCENSVEWKSNVGCEYYAVDLDNAVTQGLDASAQQYALVVSNPSNAEAIVTIEINEAGFGEEPDTEVVDERIVSPMDLDVILLDEREVDGATPHGLDDGTGSALTANAYRITSTAPIVVYQFNPLDNVDVFSNDASILIPITACGTEYDVISWPQTIAETANPDTNMHNDLRAFLTVVGTDYETQVSLQFPLDDRLRILGDGDLIPDMIGGDEFEIELGPYEVLNLESNGFMADFTGTKITSSKPVVVFTGSEASDVPTFEDLSTRQCCADHLEQQLYPANRNGRKYVAGLTPLRTFAVKMAGGDVTVHDETEYFKILGLQDDTLVRTSLPSPYDVLDLDQGEHITVETTVDFVAEADKPVAFAQMVASQNVTGIDLALPGGDPAFIMVPPVEQWRSGYVFLTPSLYAFDFIIVAHTPSAEITLDGRGFPPTCKTTPVPGAETEFEITRCQLSFPEIDETQEPPAILEGDQDDGVHEILSDEPVGIVVYGFDRYVSYGYPGGTDLHVIE